MKRQRSFKLLSIFLTVFIIISSLSGVVSANELPFNDEDSSTAPQDVYDQVLPEEKDYDFTQDEFVVDSDETAPVIDQDTFDEDVIADEDVLPANALPQNDSQYDFIADEVEEQDIDEAMPAEDESSDDQPDMILSAPLEDIHIDADDCAF